MLVLSATDKNKSNRERIKVRGQTRKEDCSPDSLGKCGITWRSQEAHQIRTCQIRLQTQSSLALKHRNCFVLLRVFSTRTNYAFSPTRLKSREKKKLKTNPVSTATIEHEA